MGTVENEYTKYKLKYEPHFEEKDEIGRGGFGMVFSAKVRRPGMLKHELCAVKRISKINHLFPRSKYERELAMFIKLLQHEWFVQFFGWHEDDNYIYIAMEYMEFGDLQQHLTFKWTENDTKVVASQLLEGIMVMHNDGIIHRDLKPANIFPVLLDDYSLHVKIGDFGVSKRVSNDSSTVAETQTGSREYMAPEVLYPLSTTTHYTNSVDLWALGCLLYRMLVGEIPFSVGNVALYMFGQRSFPRRELQLSGVCEAGIEFLHSLMRPNPKDRLTAEAALKNDWIMSKPSKLQVTEQLGRYLNAWQQAKESERSDVVTTRVPQQETILAMPSRHTLQLSQSETNIAQGPTPAANTSTRLSQQHTRAKPKLLGTYARDRRLIGFALCEKPFANYFRFRSLIVS